MTDDINCWTLNDAMRRAIPAIQAYAESGTTGPHMALRHLCLLAANMSDARVALWMFMVIFASEFDGVVSELERHVELTRFITDEPTPSTVQ